MGLVIQGAEGWTSAQLLAALDQGARVVTFEQTISAGVITVTQRTAVLVPAGESPRRHALTPSLVSALLGWWSIPGLVLTPISLVKNLALGGTDITPVVRDALAVDARARERAGASAAAGEGPADELVPDTPEARRAMAVQALDRHQVDVARELLDDMLTAGPHQDRALLHRLAVALYDRQELASSLEVFAVLVRDFPEQPLLSSAEAQVRHMERALGRATSIVPPPRWHQTLSGWAAALGACALLCALALCGANEWLRRHRTVHVVNATDHDVVVRFEPGPDGAPRAPLPVGSGMRASFEVEEGDHALAIEHPGGRTERVVAPVRSSWGERFVTSVFVVNVDRAAAFLYY